MSLISDVRDELRQLDTSNCSIRKFTLLVGCSLIIISIWLWIKDFSLISVFTLSAFGLILILGGFIIPRQLIIPFKIWMGLAYSMGWIVSRMLLLIIFYMLITPIALIGKLFGNKFIEINFNEKKDTYWIQRDSNKKIDYEKMY